MKFPIYRSTFNLNLSKRVPFRVVFTRGGFPIDASGMVRGAMLAIGGGVDLSAIALIRYTLFYFNSRVSRGAIVVYLTRLKEKKFIVIFCKVQFFIFIHRLKARCFISAYVI